MKASDANAARVLIADDQEEVQAALRFLLKSEAYRFVAVTSPAGNLEASKQTVFEAALIDLNCARDTTSGNWKPK